MLDYAQARRLMVDGQLRTYDVNDVALIAAFDVVPRERFVPAGREPFAYADRDLVVAADGDERRVMLAPMVLARLIQALAVRPGERVLDVAPGLGYSTALMAHMGGVVTALEATPALAEGARGHLAATAAETRGDPRGAVRVEAGGLADRVPAGAPFDAVLVNGAVEVRPTALLDALADGGRLACVVGSGRSAKATLFVRAGSATGSRPLFDAAAPVLPAFRAAPAFVF